MTVDSPQSTTTTNFDGDLMTTHDRDTDHDIQLKPTPLPKLQLFIVLLVQFAEPVTSTVIYPFINQFVRDTGITKGDERKTGYYAGTIESTFFLAECLTVVQWGYLSDRFGRRSILLFGPLGLAFAMLIFGLSTTFWPLVLSRCLQGVFNGNIGVAKSVVAEISDSSNIGDAYALIPFTWSFGVTIGPILGGVLTDPAKHWPNTLGRIRFLRTHPYFLPCAAAAFIAFLTFVVAALGLKESLPSLVFKKKLEKYRKTISDDEITSEATAETRLLDHGEDLSYGTENPASRHPSDLSESPTVIGTPAESNNKGFRALLVRPLLMIFLNNTFLAFLDMSHFVLIPLMYSTPLRYGGLGLDPFHIGVTLGAFGFVNSIIQMNFLGRLLRKHGSRTLYIVSFSSMLFCFLLYPIMSFFAQRAGGVDPLVIACITVQLGFQMMTSMAYGSIQVMVVQNIPENGSLAMANGVTQMLSSGMRTIAPTFASSLFSISLQRRLAGGNMVYYILIGVTLIGMRVSRLLPDSAIKEKRRRIWET